MAQGNATFRQAVLSALSSTAASDSMNLLKALSEDEVGFLEFAKRNRIASVVAHAAIRAGLCPGAFRAVHDAELKRMHVLLGELEMFAARCELEGVRVVALKNAGIARGVYPCPGCCPMGDVDVLVERARFLDAHRIILESGFVHASRSAVEPAQLELCLVGGGAEYYKRVDGEDVWVEVQWRPVAGRWINQDQEPDGSAMIVESVSIPGSAVRLLNPTDNMLQVCLHTAKHSYVRAPGIRLHCDVDRLVAFAPPDWSKLVMKASALRVKSAVYFSLRCACDLLGTPVPVNALEALAPPVWKRRLVMDWLKKADFFEPDRRKFSRVGMMGLHALLYDDLRGLAASAMNTRRDRLGVKFLPGNLVRGVRRVVDVATRFQR